MIGGCGGEKVKPKRFSRVAENAMWTAGKLRNSGEDGVSRI